MKVYIYHKSNRSKPVCIVFDVLSVDLVFDEWFITSATATIKYDRRQYAITVFGY